MVLRPLRPIILIPLSETAEKDEIMANKRYDGILFCTDYDGTLFYDGVHPDNLEAIREFMENGGRFTLATGRANYEVRQADLPVHHNAPMLCMIGSRI